jgi:hypothetical protein
VKREGLLNIWIQINGLKNCCPERPGAAHLSKFGKPLRRNDVDARGSANRAPPGVFLVSPRDIFGFKERCRVTVQCKNTVNA